MLPSYNVKLLSCRTKIRTLIKIHIFKVPRSKSTVRNTETVFWDVHCKDIIPKIRNKYSQERNCVAQSQTYIHVSVSDLYISTIGLPILMQENRLMIVRILRSLPGTWMWKLLHSDHWARQERRCSIMWTIFCILTGPPEILKLFRASWALLVHRKLKSLALTNFISAGV